ncbi:hypothetical protein KKF45_05630 [Patescibacteria group bacterium]|nr:hypothetical protein [Patescibacteria group bacterium]
MTIKNDSLQVIIKYNNDTASFNMYDELTITDDFDSFLRKQAAEYAFWANLRVEAQVFCDKELTEYSLWYARAYDFIKYTFDVEAAKVTINVIENTLKRVFLTSFLLNEKDNDELLKYKDLAAVFCKGSNPFNDFTFNAYDLWQKKLLENKLYVDKLKVFERAMEIKGSMLQTLCANKRQEEKLLTNDVFIKESEELNKEKHRRVSFDQAACRNSLLLRVNK